MKKEVSKKKLAVFLVASMLLITFTFYFYQVIYTPNILVDQADRLIVIKPNSTFAQVRKQLADAHIVNDVVSFSFVARIMSYDRGVRAGRYMLRRNMSNRDAIRELKNGRREIVKVTFAHVRLIDELTEKITSNTGVTNQEFRDALDEFIESNDAGFTKENILCMFIPNTYEVYYNLTPKDLVQRMFAEYKKFWNQSRIEKAQKVGLTPIEVSILASIVQAESAKKDEAPVIAGLYLNRLRKGIPLQADPTLIFAAGDFTIKRVLNEHKEIDSPYNTYKYAGLPPGPVNMPYVLSIDAVLNFRPHDYYYMCAKEDFSGYHNFANDLNTHTGNARRYQRALKAELRKASQKK
jgi:UPF0755 protein